MTLPPARVRSLLSLPLLLAPLTAMSRAEDPPVLTSNPILFVTQVPVAWDYLTVVSTFGNHRTDPHSAPRGGDLWIRYPNGDLRNLTAEVGYGEPGVFQGARGIAVREPCVHWSGAKAVFSMLVGSPTAPTDGDWLWQLYEIEGLGRNETAVIRRVPRQPPLRNNIAPCYASDDRILFVSDRPRNGAQRLHPQLDEYEEAPTTTGVWSLDPQNGELFLMEHAPSGAFRPSVDSFGRVLFTRWDHLERDQQADLDRIGISNYQVYNWSGEEPDAVPTGSRAEVFPEPRPPWIYFVNNTPEYDGPLAGWAPYLTGNSFNHFLPWTIQQDGTGEETLNHLGRNELFGFVPQNRLDDFNVTGQPGFLPWIRNQNPITAFHQIREDPLVPGAYLGVDCQEFDTHASGQIVRLIAAPDRNANEVVVQYVTHPDTRTATSSPRPDHSGLYRTPLPLSRGQWIASHTFNTLEETNLGTPTFPRSRFDFRMKTLELGANGHMVAGQPLTRGIKKRLQYLDPFNLISWEGELWELDPVEVVARPVPPLTGQPGLEAPERGALAQEGINPIALRRWLVSQGLALIVVRNVTSRDKSDRQQPFNLRVPGGIETTGTTGRVYDVSHLRLFQGDLIRGITNGVVGSAEGRRVLAQPLHDPNANNPPAPGAPSGSVVVAPDGSVAALVPARRAMSWSLVDPAGEAVVNERYWVSLQPGEIRTCTGCHGANEFDQANRLPPRNTPQALRELMQHLKTTRRM